MARLTALMTQSGHPSRARPETFASIHLSRYGHVGGWE